MSTGVEVRRAKMADAAAIAEVHVASWRGAYESLLPAPMLAGLSVERRAVQWQGQLAVEDQSTWIALVGGQVVGFASAGRARDAESEPSVGELYAIYVTPNWWGRSVGHALHEAAVAELGSGYGDAVLWVLEGNDRARTFYERHGWSLDGAVKTENRDEAVLHEVRYRRRVGRLHDM